MDLRRDKRYSISVAGRYRRGTGVRFNIAITDLSEYGCQFADLVGRVHPEDKISIRIGEIGPIDAQVRWVERRQVGVQFANPLYPSVLEYIIAQGGTNDAASA